MIDTLKQWGHSLDNFKHGAIEKLHELAIPLNPLSKFRITWDILAAIFIVYEMIVDPYLLAFELEPEGSLDTLEVIKLIFFLLDILLNFHTAFYYEGNLKKKHKEIAKNYIQSTFFLDLIASFAALTLLGTKNNLARLLHFLRIYRFRIILRVIDDFAQGFILLNGILNLSVLILYLFLLCHWCACIWRYVGAYNLIADDASWMREHDYNLLNNADLYIVSFYWSVTTILTVGYGDILPKTSSERIITIFVMFLGCIIFSYSVNSVSKIANTIDAGMSKKRYFLLYNY
jgi:Ion transport protein.